jgi:Zn-dependent M28 family amino/carboxypeptidase
MRHHTPLALATLIGAAGIASCAHRAGTASTGVIDIPPITPGTPMAMHPPRDVERAIDTVSPDRARADIDAMVSFGTRHTESDAVSPTRGIGAARAWVAAEFRAASTPHRAMDVAFVGHTQQPVEGRITRPTEIVNVVATLPGTLPDAHREEIWVLAHLDSRITERSDSTGDSPGANDDASGVAVLLAIARALGDMPLDHTVVLAATSGEEQGLFGAAELAGQARSRDARIRAVLNNDTVGDPIGAHAPGSAQAREARKVIRVFSFGVQGTMPPERIAQIASLGAESDSPARQVARYMADVADLHDLPVRPALIFRNDRFLRGGDHTAFLREGFEPSVRLTVPYEDYTRQHEDVRDAIDPATGRTIRYGDTAEWIDAEYLADVARLNLATVIHLANAPTSPASARIVTATLDTTTTIRWEPSPDPDVRGYEIVARPTTSPVWTTVLAAGDGAEITLPLSKDNLIFGVRAVDHDGFRSIVSPCGSARE